MPAVNPSVIHGVIGGVALIVAYGFSFWRIFKHNPGSKVIECGSITLMLFIIAVVLFKVPNFPVWILASLFLLIFLLCLLTLGFLVQQGYRAVRHRKMQ
jgi:hypothetical protein